MRIEFADKKRLPCQFGALLTDRFNSDEQRKNYYTQRIFETSRSCICWDVCADSISQLCIKAWIL